jgi:hypothetical protein
VTCIASAFDSTALMLHHELEISMLTDGQICVIERVPSGKNSDFVQRKENNTTR